MLHLFVPPRLPALALLVLASLPARAIAQASGGAGPTSSIFSNLANPAIGMNALFSGQAAHNLDQSYGLDFEGAEISLLSVVDPYWTFSSNIVFLPDHTVDPEEVWVRSTNIPSVQLRLGELRGTFGKHGLLHYGQQHIMPSGSGNSAPMAKGSPILLCITVSGIRRPPALREAGSLRPYCDQEDQFS
jgi:hypothetical protein